MAPKATVSIFYAHLFFAETTEFQEPKIPVPNSVVDLLQADILAGAGNADVDTDIHNHLYSTSFDGKALIFGFNSTVKEYPKMKELLEKSFQSIELND